MLYVIGGYDVFIFNLIFRFLDCVERYDFKIDVWIVVVFMSVSRDVVGVCLFGDKLYVVGGYDG